MVLLLHKKLTSELSGYMHHVFKGVSLQILVMLSTQGLAQEASPPGQKNDENDASEYFQPVKYSDKQRAKTCAKYKNAYVSYYSSVFKVEKCKLRPLESHEEVLEINRKKYKITEIPGSVIAQLEKGRPITSEKTNPKKLRSCKELERRYVTFSYTDVYFVEKCKKRAFPDWTSFIEHRKKHKRNSDLVLALTWPEFGRLKTGRSMASAIDREFLKYNMNNNEADVIPINEACAGLNGKDVSYIDKIYKIEKCTKRAYDVSKFLKKNRGRNLSKMIELNSEQWLSLPDGSSMK